MLDLLNVTPMAFPPDERVWKSAYVSYDPTGLPCRLSIEKYLGNYLGQSANSKMAAINQDGGQIIWVLSAIYLRVVYIYRHTS